MSDDTQQVQPDLSVLDTIDIDLSSRGSVEYAKARKAIHEAGCNRQWRRLAKVAVIELLKGKIVQNESHHAIKDAFGNRIVRKSVQFPDGSVARF